VRATDYARAITLSVSSGVRVAVRVGVGVGVRSSTAAGVMVMEMDSDMVRPEGSNIQAQKRLRSLMARSVKRRKAHAAQNA